MSGDGLPLLERVRGYFDRHPLALDAVLVVALTAAAAALRLTLLGGIPYGVHPDEAQLGTDARRILDGDLFTVYTDAVLGQPSGHAYLTLPSFELLGYTPFAMRLPLALLAVAQVPLLYLLVRVSYHRIEAFFAAALLTVSYWHIFYSRVAHWSISYGTFVLAALLCLMLGMRARRRAWFAAAGAALGLGVYTYNIYPVAMIAVAAFVAIITFTRYRGAEWPWWRGSVAVMAVSAFVVALPMVVYIADPGSLYWDHVRDYRESASIFRTEEYREADTPGKVRVVAEQAWTFVEAYTWDGKPDIVDANGLRAMFDPLTLALFIAGLALAVRYRREPMVIAALCCVILIPLPAVLQRGSIMRQPVGAAPFAMFIAALPLAWLFRASLRSWTEQRAVAVAGILAVAGCVAVIATATVRDYFWTWREDPFTREVYFSEMTTASTYMRRLPDGTQVLFYSDRAPFDLEMRRMIAPRVAGTDRSAEYSPYGGSIEDIDRSRPAVFVLLGNYAELSSAIAEQYPGGITRTVERDGKLEFIAYELPAVE